MGEFDDEGLDVSQQSIDGSMILTLTGELDAASADVLDSYVSSLRPLTSPLRLDVSRRRLRRLERDARASRDAAGGGRGHRTAGDAGGADRRASQAPHHVGPRNGIRLGRLTALHVSSRYATEHQQCCVVVNSA